MFDSRDDWPEFKALLCELERYAPDMRREALALMASGSGFKPWHERGLYEGVWDFFGFYWAGREMERESAAPRTKDILSAWQAAVFNAGFSRVGPTSRIVSHKGPTADVIRLWLVLLAPRVDSSSLGLRVGEQTSACQEGACLLFDDTQEHEMWNKSGEPCVALVVDLLRPRGREKKRMGQ